MSFIRPEARATLWRWREALAGAGALLLGLWWGLGTSGALQWVGGAIGLAGVALIVAGIQRGRFRQGGGGPGVVQVDEGRVAYFGPFTGGVVALSEITALHLDRRVRPPRWVLSQPGQPDLPVPLDAEGSEALFDVFASLPGMRTERMLSEMRRESEALVVIWRRSNRATRRLARAE